MSDKLQDAVELYCEDTDQLGLRDSLLAELALLRDTEATCGLWKAEIGIRDSEIVLLKDELARLRAEAEAWRAVREVFTRDGDGFDLDALRDELQRQIARLDQLKGEGKPNENPS